MMCVLVRKLEYPLFVCLCVYVYVCAFVCVVCDVWVHVLCVFVIVCVFVSVC